MSYENLSKTVDLSPSDLVRLLASPSGAGESVKVKALLFRAWGQAREAARSMRVEEMSARRIKAIYYGEARAILADEVNVLRAAARAKAAPIITEEVNVSNKQEWMEYARSLERRLAELEAKVERARSGG